jgi:tripartite-type tricarboxylate transporter receptor subunit TctC
MNTISRRTITAGLILMAVGPPAFSEPAGYPTRTIQIVVPYPPGGAADMTARLVAEKLRGQLGQPIVIDNRPGANGQIGAGAVVRAEPDGHTLLWAPREVFGINPVLQPQQSHDWQKDLAYIGVAAIGPYVLVVNPALGVSTWTEFLALARTRELNYASFGRGSMAHLNIEALCRAFGLKMNHIPYRGAPAAVMAVASGDVALTISTPPAALSLMQDGRVRALAVGGGSRLKQLPDTPSMVELGVADDPLISNYFGVAAPARTPSAILERLRAEIARALAQPDVVEKLEANGLIVAAKPTATMAQLVAEDISRFGRLVRDLDIKPE